MNRTALTIKMLNYLKANNRVISRETLAAYLETNVRNIAEFKKELEAAGYRIETTSGRYGGYRLAEDSLVPTVALSEGEIMALNDAEKFLQHTNFHQLETFAQALIKIRNNLYDTSLSSDVYYLFQSVGSSLQSEYERLLRKAKIEHRYVELEYCKLNSEVWEKRLLQPYELIYSDEGNYVLALDKTLGKQERFKTFKLSDVRMRKVVLCDRLFRRDEMFKIQDYVGKQSIMKDIYKVELKIVGRQAVLLYEKEFGLMVDKKMVDQTLYLTFTMENKAKILAFILSLGADCEVLSPWEIKDALIEILQSALSRYMI